MSLPTLCPSCGSKLQVRSLCCKQCQTEIMGEYPLPVLAQLTNEEQNFILAFIKSSGSLKEMASVMKLSYPTVRNYLNDIITKIETYEQHETLSPL